MEELLDDGLGAMDVAGGDDKEVAVKSGGGVERGKFVLDKGGDAIVGEDGAGEVGLCGLIESGDAHGIVGIKC